MGQTESFQLILKEPEQFFREFLPEYNYVKTLRTGVDAGTFMCSSANQGHLVTKFLHDDLKKQDPDLIDNMRWQAECMDLTRQPNVLVTQCSQLSRAVTVLYRQYVYMSLKEKLSISTPQLTLVEKLWLAMQILCGLCQIDDRGRTHGDLKPENIMVTSANNLFLTDMVSYKPAYFKSDDIEGYNKFYGELDNNRRCYFAPERFKDDFEEGDQSYDNLDPSMDIFSAGCNIAEIFMDGKPFFDITSLRQYKKGDFSPETILSKHIKEQHLVDLILKMIDVDPAKRPTAEQCLTQWVDIAMPCSFSKVMFQLNSLFVLPNFLYSDLRISIIRKYMPSIMQTCFDSRLTVEQVEALFFEPMERAIFEKIREDGIQSFKEHVVPQCVSRQFIDCSRGGLAQELQGYQNTELDRQSIIVIVHWIGSYLNTCFFPQSRRLGLEILLVIARESSFEIRLQYILPYVFSLFEDKQPKVIVKAMEVAVLMFESIIDTEQNYKLNRTDRHVFLNYIMPHFTKVYKSHQDSQMIQVTYTKYLPLLAQIGRRFTEISVKSVLSVDQDEPAAEGADQVQSYKTANYDLELRNLRRMFHPIISDKAAQQKRPDKDGPIQMLHFSNFGQLSDFFGAKMTRNELIPLLGTCPNNRDFQIRLACLKSVIGIGIKAGKLTLNDSMLVIYSQFLQDSQELVVIEIIRTLGQLLQLKLITKSNMLREYQDPKMPECLLDKILPFLLHPNTQIREAALQFVLTACDYRRNGVLSKAQVFCFIRNQLKPYLRNPVSGTTLLMSDHKKEAKDLLSELWDPLSRQVYDSMVRPEESKFEHQQSMRQSPSDKYALQLLRDYIDNPSRKYGNSGGHQIQQKQSKIQEIPTYNLYRVVHQNTIRDLANQESEPTENFFDKNSYQYFHEFYVPCNIPRGTVQTNYGLNLDESYVSEIDSLCRALGIVPEQKKGIGSDKRSSQFKLMSQGLPDGQWIQVEKLDSGFALPTEMPQFHSKTSKIASVKIQSEAGSAFLKKNQLFSESRKCFENSYRFQGRLISTLYDHTNPVNSLAVSDDQKMLLTASKADGIVNVWSTADFEYQPQPGSRCRLQTDRYPNQVTFLQSSDYIALGSGGAGDQGLCDIYKLERAGLAQQRNGGLPNPSIPQSAEKLKTLEFEGLGEVMTCSSTTLPVSHQDLLVLGTQRGGLCIHDIRCKTNSLIHKEAFGLPRGLLQCVAQGQDAYQLMYGTVGGYVMIYDLRYNMVSTAFRHSQKYPITSLATFKPRPSQLNYNRSAAKTSPMALVSAGGPRYELSLVNLETGNVEYLMSSEDEGSHQRLNDEKFPEMTFPSYLRESMIRDPFNWPEKSETNRSLYRRYQMYTKSLINTSQIQLISNLDDELFKGLKLRYSLLMQQATKSPSLCRKVIVPRLCSSLLQGAATSDFAITGGNDARIRYWSLKDPTRSSYFINTPDNDECEYFSETVGGGIQFILEKISKHKYFQTIDSSTLSDLVKNRQAGQTLTIPNTCIELQGDSIYFSILAEMIQTVHKDKIASGELQYVANARNILTEGLSFVTGGQDLNQFSVEYGKDKVIVCNFNGLSEYQHLNGLCMNQHLKKDQYFDKWGGSSQQASRGGRSGKGSKKDTNQGQSSTTHSGGDAAKDAGSEFLFRESHNVSHSDAILDMAVLEVDMSVNDFRQSNQSRVGAINQSYLGGGRGGFAVSGDQSVPLLVTSSRDCTVKLWR